MSKVKYFPKTVGEPEKSGFFIAVIIGTIICVPFWSFVIWMLVN